MRARRRGSEEELEFQIAPMIDVLLVVLIFFIMITSASVLRSDQNLTLPVAPHAAKPVTTWREAMLNVHWESRRGWVSLDNDSYDNLERLTVKLAALAKNADNFRVLLRADRATPAHYVQQVMAASAAAGINEVVFTAVNHD